MTERKHFKPGVHFFLLGQAKKIGDGIGTRTENEDDGDSRRGIIEGSFEIEDRRLNEDFAKIVEDKVFDEEDEFFLPKNLIEHHLLEDI